LRILDRKKTYLLYCLVENYTTEKIQKKLLFQRLLTGYRYARIDTQRIATQIVIVVVTDITIVTSRYTRGGCDVLNATSMRSRFSLYKFLIFNYGELQQLSNIANRN